MLARVTLAFLVTCLLVGCGTHARAANPTFDGDSGAAQCSNRGHFSCGDGRSYVTQCDCVAVTWVDGPCAPVPNAYDGGPRTCTDFPNADGCPCDSTDAHPTTRPRNRLRLVTRPHSHTPPHANQPSITTRSEARAAYDRLSQGVWEE